MIPESTIRAFLDTFAYPETCKKCGVKIYVMIDKHRQPHIFTIDLAVHSHEQSKTPQVKKMIEDERRSPGGAW